ncbi:nucleotidyltransferase family protein [Mangrovibacterium diazotrophicum]|uniref:Nucleotidyltransferase-like protein n=1 Tax=Mangrovibacterium diazotrophicum TaxID=1261403 RepID=A0A419W516_9BACT|nr:sugar phosphate nucleotidyltransferase [Mangrovibacterium diazotrophicum]RKD90552.1 nucleotidyltransferase-like protein [Mangrovibacterium diazotrophicum]
MKPTLLILAAGMGSRYGGLKQIDPFGPSGETILEYSVYDAIRAGFGKVVFVIRESFADEFKSRFDEKLKGKIQVEYVFQELAKLPEGYTCPADREKPWGTGHAILMAKDVINEPFAAINADDFYGAPAFQTIADFFNTEVSENKYCMVGYLLKNTLSENGTVSRGICGTDDKQNLVEINERHQIRREGDVIVYEAENKELVELGDDTPASMNFWGFHPSLFEHLESQFKAFLDEKMLLPKSEFYIPSVVFELIKSGTVNTKVLQADSPWFGVTYTDDKAHVTEQIQKLTAAGIYPEKLW